MIEPRHASRDMIMRAMDFCRQKARIVEPKAVADALRRGDTVAHDYFRYGLAREIGSFVGNLTSTVKSVYLIEPEATEGEFAEERINPAIGLSMIAWVDDGGAALLASARALGQELLREYKALVGPAVAEMHALLTLTVVNDGDVQSRTGLAALITSIVNPATKVWSRFVIQLNADYCGRCRICANVCPYDAIVLSAEATAAKIDLQKCQVCGICYSACPSGAIEASYYDFSSLIRGVRSSVRANGFKAVVLSCRGSTPTTQEIRELLGTPDFLSICLPCIGRIPSDFFFKAVSMGIERIAVIPCADGHCRFEDGNRNIRNRMLLLQLMLRDLNYDPGLVTLHKGKVPVAQVNTDLCSGCGTCMRICPYSAIRPEDVAGGILSVMSVDAALCQGCGACVAACPSRAIELSRFADAQVIASIQEALATQPANGARILGFRCNWCSYGEDDLPFDRMRYGDSIDVVPVPCVGRIDPLHVLWAFLNGAEGVFLGGCHPDNCRYEGGSHRTEERVSMLQGLLEVHSFDPRRLSLVWIKREAPDAYANAIRAFASQVEQLGRLPWPEPVPLPASQKV
jgi:F420-non-reducing hydrogenase iron-sulfur subunit